MRSFLIQLLSNLRKEETNIEKHMFCTCFLLLSAFGRMAIKDSFWKSEVTAGHQLHQLKKDQDCSRLSSRSFSCPQPFISFHIHSSDMQIWFCHLIEPQHPQHTVTHIATECTETGLHNTLWFFSWNVILRFLMNLDCFFETRDEIEHDFNDSLDFTRFHCSRRPNH